MRRLTNDDMRDNEANTYHDAAREEQLGTWYDHVQECIRARFGDKLPKHFDRLMKRAADIGADYPYMHGCSINSVYNRRARSRLFNKPFPVPCRLKDSVSVLKPTTEHGDPLPWMDNKYRVVYEHIKARRGRPLKITTRSDLIACDDYMDVLDKDNHRIVIILSKFDPNKLRRMEPGAPSNHRRVDAYNKLKAAGFNVKLINPEYSIVRGYDDVPRLAAR